MTDLLIAITAYACLGVVALVSTGAVTALTYAACAAITRKAN